MARRAPHGHRSVVNAGAPCDGVAAIAARVGRCAVLNTVAWPDLRWRRHSIYRVNRPTESAVVTGRCAPSRWSRLRGATGYDEAVPSRVDPLRSPLNISRLFGSARGLLRPRSSRKQTTCPPPLTLLGKGSRAHRANDLIDRVADVDQSRRPIATSRRSPRIDRSRSPVVVVGDLGLLARTRRWGTSHFMTGTGRRLGTGFAFCSAFVRRLFADARRYCLLASNKT